ncbi:hypothetical protein TrST_g10494 [Triparma strigata]|uniref:Disease resistance R13L4/SHOC-2-like LRR domain-containing protein n=1 Tax=Triparma strigata TaxID=1606541 RepID=A0A9W7ENZ7_9STRA|nr:hypothetical protein TrST_g10494 [Triparma strigata]
MAGLGRLFSIEVHKHVQSLEVWSGWLRFGPLSGDSKASIAQQPWGTKEVYASTVTNTLFPPNKYPNLKKLTVTPDWHDWSLRSQRLKYSLTAHKRSSGYTTSEEWKDAEEHQGGYKRVDYFFVAALMKRFPDLMDFGGTFDLEAADLFSSELAESNATQTRLTASRSIKSINLNRRCKWNQWGLFLGGVLDDHSFAYLLNTSIKTTFPHLTSLEISLDIDSVKLHSLVTALPHLRSLKLQFPNLRDFIPASLEAQRNSDNEAYRDKASRLVCMNVKELFHLPNLSSLDINGPGNSLWENGQDKLPGPLELLSLFSPHNSTLTSLTLTNLSQGKGIPAVVFTLVNLRVLDLSDNRMGMYGSSTVARLPKEIGDLKELRVIDLSSNCFTGKLPREIYWLTKLEVLKLDKNQLTGILSSKVENLKKLEVLNLSRNKFYGKIPPQIGKLQSLIELDLRINNFTGTVPSHLGKCTKLRTLGLYSHRVFMGTGFPVAQALSNGALPYDYEECPLPEEVRAPQAWKKACWDHHSRLMIFNDDTQVQAFLAFLRKDDEMFWRLYTTLVGGNEEEEATEFWKGKFIYDGGDDLVDESYHPGEDGNESEDSEEHWDATTYSPQELKADFVDDLKNTSGCGFDPSGGRYTHILTFKDQPQHLYTAEMMDKNCADFARRLEEKWGQKAEGAFRSFPDSDSDSDYDPTDFEKVNKSTQYNLGLHTSLGSDRGKDSWKIPEYNSDDEAFIEDEEGNGFDKDVADPGFVGFNDDGGGEESGDDSDEDIEDEEWEQIDTGFGWGPIG